MRILSDGNHGYMQEGLARKLVLLALALEMQIGRRLLALLLITQPLQRF
jgi:hypothetical protein